MVTLMRRRNGLVTAFCIAALISAAACVAVSADDAAAGEERLINIDVRDMALSDVLRMLGQAANVNIIVGQGVDTEIKSLTLRDVSVETALRTITQAEGYYWRKDGNIYVVTAEPQQGVAPGPGPGPQPEQAEGPEGQPDLGDVPPPPLPDAYAGGPQPRGDDGGPRIIRVYIPLRYANAADVAAYFGGITLGAQRVDRYRPAGSAYSDIPAYRGMSSTGMGQFGLARAGVTAGALGQEPGEFAPGVGGPLGGFTQPGTGTPATTTTTGTTTGGATGLLPGNMQPPMGILRDNSILVQGTPEEIDEFREILALLDTPAKQVEIETKWMNVAVTAAEAIGIDWAVSNGALEVWNLGFAPGEAANNGIRYGRGRFWAELAVLENTGQAVVINQPRVTCQNGTPGMISFSTEIPYFTATISYNQFGQRTVDYTSDFVSVANDLFEKPQINPDDSVRMQLSPQLQDQVGTVEGPNGERIPIITTQFVDTMIRVGDGETIVLGGVVRRDEAINMRKTPLLADIPIIGKLFRSKRVETSETELLIFVTPRIVRDVATE